jgi:hypothetical protein
MKTLNHPNVRQSGNSEAMLREYMYPAGGLIKPGEDLLKIRRRLRDVLVKPEPGMVFRLEARSDFFDEETGSTRSFVASESFYYTIADLAEVMRYLMEGKGYVEVGKGEFETASTLLTANLAAGGVLSIEQLLDLYDLLDGSFDRNRIVGDYGF